MIVKWREIAAFAPGVRNPDAGGDSAFMRLEVEVRAASAVLDDEHGPLSAGTA